MKAKLIASSGLLLCFVLIVSVPISAFALTDRPPQRDEQGNLVPNEFAEGDALRYGGLFGPLRPPDDGMSLFGMNRPGIDARDMGFERDTQHFRQINPIITHSD